MTIESLYWKEELGRIAKSLRPVVKLNRWSERAVCAVERDVMIGFFIVRRMIELHKVSSDIEKIKIDTFSTPLVKNVNKINRFSLDKNYKWIAEKREKKSVYYVCNQFIHSYLSHVERAPDRNWSNLLLTKTKIIWRIPFATIIHSFEAVWKSWPSKGRWIFGSKSNDYQVSVM